MKLQFISVDFFFYHFKTNIILLLRLTQIATTILSDKALNKVGHITKGAKASSGVSTFANAVKLAKELKPTLEMLQSFKKEASYAFSNVGGTIITKIPQGELLEAYYKFAKSKDGGKGTGKEYKNYKDVEYTGTTKVNGEVRDISRRVFQRLDIDYMRIDPKTGMTNLQLMKKGRAPIWQDGTAIELHHLIQREPGSMVELPGSMHKEYYKILHGLVENGGSFRNDPVLKKQYENFRSKYWRWRAKQIDKAEL